MPVAQENDTIGGGPLVVSREPKGPKKSGDVGSLGDTALKDAITLIIIAWAILFLLAYSLRAHNI